MVVIPGKAPDWLLAYLEKPATPATVVQPPSASNNPAERIRAQLARPDATGPAPLRWLDRAAAELAATPEGQRNDTLNRIAFDQYALVKGGRLDYDTVTAQLTQTAAGAGLTDKETRATLGSAWSKAPAKTGAPMRETAEAAQASLVAQVAVLATGTPEPGTQAPAAAESRMQRQAREQAEQQMSALEEKVAYIRARLLDSEALDALPAPVPLIDGILMRDSLAVLYGKPGSGKSFVAMDWALCVATKTWWDMRAVHQGKVLYIAAEGASGLGKRKRAWTRHQNYAGPVPNIVWYPERINLLDTLAPAALVVVAKELAPELIIVDTLSRSMPGGNENAPEDMGRAIENVDWLRRETGATVLLVHHTPKDGSSIRGHSSLEGAASTAVEVKKSESAVTISVEKQKDTVEEPPITMFLTPVQLGPEADPMVDSAILTPIGSWESSSTPESEQKLMRVLWESSGSEGLTSKTLMELAALPESTFHRAKKALEDRGAMANVGSNARPRWRPVQAAE